MKLLKPVVVALAAAVLLTGCLYMDVKTPYDTDLNKTVLGQKTGKAHSQSVLWLFAWGDAGTAAAAKAGNITTVNQIDHGCFRRLGRRHDKILRHNGAPGPGTPFLRLPNRAYLYA